MIVYLACPYTNGDACANVNRAVKIAEQVVNIGHTPMLPILAHLWHLISPHDYEYWMKIDVALLAKADAVLRVYGYSEGADKEVFIAHELNIPVFYNLESLKDHKWGDDAALLPG